MKVVEKVKELRKTKGKDGKEEVRLGKGRGRVGKKKVIVCVCEWKRRMTWKR